MSNVMDIALIMFITLKMEMSNISCF